MYNCGTWALTDVLAEKLDRPQRKMLRRVLNVKWFDKVTNEQLYERCMTTPASLLVVDARWRLFGHTLRLNENTPARMSMACYFAKDIPGRKGNRTTISSVLSSEYRDLTGLTISNINEYSRMIDVANDRTRWRELVDDVNLCQHNMYVEKVKRKTELRHEAKRKREEQAAIKAPARVRRRIL